MVNNRMIKLAIVLTALSFVLCGCGLLDVFAGAFSGLCEDPLRVTTTVDKNDGVCTPDDCSLREAVISSNACDGKQTIIIEEDVTFNLTIEGRGEDQAATGDLDIWDDVDIFKHWPLDSGPFLSLVSTIDAGGIDRVFDVHEGNLSAGYLALANGVASQGGALRIARGSRVYFRAAYFNDNFATDEGGAIHNAGQFSSSYPTQLSENQAEVGAAIYISGRVHLAGCLISRNRADEGVVFVSSGGWFELVGCSLSNNTAPVVVNQGTFEMQSGDAVANVALSGNEVEPAAVVLVNEDGAQADIDTSSIGWNRSQIPTLPILWNSGKLAFRNVTMYQNELAGLGIRNNPGGQVKMENSVVALNGESDCSGPIESLGGNVLTSVSCRPREDLGDKVVEANPTALGLKPGERSDLLFFPLQGSSPAIDNSTDSCAEEDIRRHSRPIDGDGDGSAVCDSGSFELQESGMAVATASATLTADIDINFNADLYTIERGECTTLRWKVTGADTITLLGLEREATEAQQVCPDQTTGYTLTAENETSEESAFLQIEVTKPSDDSGPQTGCIVGYDQNQQPICQVPCPGDPQQYGGVCTE